MLKYCHDNFMLPVSRFALFQKGESVSINRINRIKTPKNAKCGALFFAT